MKKQVILTTIAAGALSAGAYGQGLINVNNSVANSPGITTQGLNATSTSSATTYFSGTISLEVFALASATQGELNAINAYANTANGGNLALALAQTDGFLEVSTISVGSSTIGAVSGTISSGSFDFTSNANVGLANVTTSSVESLLLYAVVTGGAYAGDSGVVAFNNSVGGSPFASPPGTAASLTGWGTLNQNLVLSPVPEPTTMALAGLGSLSLFLFRRKK